MPQSVKWLLFLTVAVALFYWKILFTAQFSILADWESANQAYAWHNFAVSTIQQGNLPFWNPYSLSGHTFVGEMQTGLFYPLKLLLYVWPLDASGLLSQRLFHQFFVLAHLLGAVFLFFLAREIGIRTGFSAFVASLCFALGGFVGRMPWPNMLDSAIWLPLIFWFLLRALKSKSSARMVLYASLSGLALGMAILAGSLHVPIMQTIFVVSAAVFFSLQTVKERTGRDKLAGFRSSALVVVIIGAVAFVSGAVQILPSMEYGSLAMRWTGDWAGLATAKIPYAILGEGMAPRSLFAFLFGGAAIGTSEFSPYFGIVPLFLAIIGAWRNWEKPWVRYLTGLGLLAFFYALGSASFLHGVLYLAPLLDKAREAGRFLYLTHFAMALLAGFGVEALFTQAAASRDVLSHVRRVLKWTVLLVLAALAIPTLYGTPDVNEWFFFSFLLLAASWALFLYVEKHQTAAAKFLLASLILCDLYAFDWVARSRMSEQKSGTDHLEQLLATRDLAEFFHSQTGLFRVHMKADFPPNVADIYSLQTTGGAGVSLLKAYLPYFWTEKGLRLLNVRYVVSADDHPDGRTPVFRSGVWNVYENPLYYPRAWVVYRAVRDPLVEDESDETRMHRITREDFDPLRVALLNEPLEVELAGRDEPPAEIRYGPYQPDRMELTVRSGGPGMMVLSEIHYPGWEATVNGKASHVYRVNGLLRGVIVSAGENRIVFEYRPRSIFIGAILSAIAVLTIVLFAIVLLARSAKTNDYRVAEF